MTWRRFKNLKLRRDGPQIVRGVFAVYYQPVKASGSHQFGTEGVCKAEPAAENCFAIVKGLFEAIAWGWHGGSLGL